jgi:hypothetical protein
VSISAVTTTKIATGAVGQTDVAESLMKRVTVRDTPNGHAVGWNPDGATVTFTIDEPAVSGAFTGFVSISVEGPGNTNHFCNTISQTLGTFQITCSTGPPETSVLDYVVENLPQHIIE